MELEMSSTERLISHAGRPEILDPETVPDLGRLDPPLQKKSSKSSGSTSRAAFRNSRSGSPPKPGHFWQFECVFSYFLALFTQKSARFLFPVTSPNFLKSGWHFAPKMGIIFTKHGSWSDLPFSSYEAFNAKKLTLRCDLGNCPFDLERLW